MGTERQFRRRVLLVDSDDRCLLRCSRMFRKAGYEVLTANDGFAALLVLRGGSHPDLVIAELSLARMSGFELLSIVRTRFPQVAVIAVSGEYTPVTVPHEAICDAFIAKGTNFDFELLQEGQKLVSESPLRSTRAKSDVAPVWIPHSGTGYIILTCPECLRSFSAREGDPGRVEENCICCGSKVPFEMSLTKVKPTPPSSPLLKARLTRAKSRQLLAETRRVRD